jgi:hypothetical protein
MLKRISEAISQGNIAGISKAYETHRSHHSLSKIQSEEGPIHLEFSFWPNQLDASKSKEDRR